MRRKPPTVLVAPDSFKGSLSASGAARAIARGVAAAVPDAVVDLCPLADGGEGTLDALLTARNGAARTATVSGPRGSPVTARWALFPEGLAVIEVAEAVGLGLVPQPERDPTTATSFGVGELVREALGAGARSIVIGLGGTATMDLGSGMAQALGVEFQGGRFPMRGADLETVRRIDTRNVDSRIRATSITAAVDVDNPLLGENGACRIYGAQKGATPEQIDALERGFEHVAGLLGDRGEHAGDGAAGGLAFMLRTVFDARVESGAALIQSAVSFDSRLLDADLVLTGEGRLDAQTARGKVVCAVGRAAKARRVPVVALAGAVDEGAGALHDEGVDAWFSICDRPLSEDDARAHAAALLTKVAENVMRLRFRGG